MTDTTAPQRASGPAWPAVAAAGIGATLTVLAAVAWSMPGTDSVRLAVVAAGTATLGAIAAAVGLRVVRGRSFGTQATAVAVAAFVPALLGVWAGAESMVLDEHDVGALVVILLASGTVAVVAALILGNRVGRSSDDLVAVARGLGDGQRPWREGTAETAELARLRRELARSATRLDDARARELALDTSRRELVAWVSHDLRTPLAGIKALVEVLEDGLAGDAATVARYHQALGVEVDRLGALIDDLFELSRTQAGVLQLEFERVSLGDLVSDAIAGATPVAAAKGVRLEGRLNGPPPELRASAPEVLRVLRNLLENAIRHTPPDGSVTIELGEDEEFAYVAVADDGGGIADADLDRVFDVAFRNDPARTPGEGAGLGLAIAKSLVEAHAGKISVRNDNGGARFTMRLPLETTPTGR
jgi:signal transduction histidine kinase